jgi:hypothetical protein
MSREEYLYEICYKPKNPSKENLFGSSKIPDGIRNDLQEIANDIASKLGEDPNSYVIHPPDDDDPNKLLITVKSELSEKKIIPAIEKSLKDKEGFSYKKVNPPLIKDICFLCGSDAQSGSYNHGNGKAFIDCVNESCGEYLITYGAMRKLESKKEKEKFSRWATSSKKIKMDKEILEITYKGDIEANIKPLEKVLTEKDIKSFGFNS